MIAIDSGLLSGLTFAGAGAFLLVREIVAGTRALVSTTWPTVVGEIESAALVQDTRAPRIVSPGAMSGFGRVVPIFKPEIRYRYRIGDQTHDGTRVDFSNPVSFSSLQAAQHLVSRYAGRKKVTVYVSARDPAISVLEPGLHRIDLIKLGTALGVLAIGVLLMLPHFGIHLSGWLTWIFPS